MPRRTTAKAKRDNRAEYKRFLETAKKVEASDDPKDFERAFKRIASPKDQRSSRGGK